MSDKPKFDATTKYTDPRGIACLYCDKTGETHRLASAARFDRGSDGELPALVVPCYCSYCANEWTETYRLQGVELKSGDKGQVQTRKAR